jgi:hypothetical protein
MSDALSTAHPKVKKEKQKDSVLNSLLRYAAAC